MDSYRTSIWEEETFLRPAEVTVVGGGIVGINAAIAIKERQPDKDVLLIDRNTFPLGASTRNAGFACFGSVTELLDDLSSSSEVSVFELLEKRRKGLELLRSRVGDGNMKYIHTGSFEMFDKAEANVDQYRGEISNLNELIESYTGLKKTFIVQEGNSFNFKGFHDFHIYNQHEGQLHPGLMMQSLYSQAAEKGVRFLMGHTISNIEAKGQTVVIQSSKFQIQTDHLLVCTNGFTSNFMPGLELLPARNQVFVTKEIANLEWNACFHYDKGYVYFRNIGKRLLIGGGRNIAKEKETTTDFDITDEIESYLMQFLKEKIGLTSPNLIEYKWSGILGVGKQKTPILKKHQERIILAVRLGGMGVALGSLLGQEAANLLFD